MRKIVLAMLVAIGVSACAGPSATDAGLCLAQRADVARLMAALEAHSDTPDAVGDAATDVVIGFESGCG
ncbi:hypothetical protein LO749_16865 [Paracoccus denitrificans]|uniref:hypothetical protein n=1 Tax=Paracoccus denitrificans TaxID=266 RepID=UPI001E57FDBC|nr:hypothetical protein [Paracoccus denitrificans]UFS67763.1 hypothetical protein LO749_16865 [Paracoccus denitrificans]